MKKNFCRGFSQFKVRGILDLRGPTVSYLELRRRGGVKKCVWTVTGSGMIRSSGHTTVGVWTFTDLFLGVDPTDKDWSFTREPGGGWTRHKRTI